ncbi:MAG TPA: potassium channel protein [Dissulfurispiraceae bacterium]|nr:potassium channel protein [Dissulfurispiraceae bacterium]
MLYRRVVGILIALTVVILAGTIGYWSLDEWTIVDALYMTIITIASVGYMEVRPLSDQARVFTIVLILAGSAVLIYGISVVTAFIVEGELTDVLRRKRMNSRISGLSGHYIVCGADRTGMSVIEELVKIRRDFVVIENSPDRIRDLMGRGILCVEGRATRDAVLLQAGIERARGLISSLETDAENLFVVITAKRLAPSVRVISKAIEEESDEKIRMAGADSVVLPDFIGGMRMVSEMVRPSVVTFLDVMLRVKDKTIRVEDIDVPPDSPLLGRSIAETGIADIEGVTLVAMKNNRDGSYTFNPQKKTVLTEDTTLVVMGYVDAIHEIRERQKLRA